MMIFLYRTKEFYAVLQKMSIKDRILVDSDFASVGSMDHAGLLIMKEMQIGLFLYMITEESSL